MRFAWVVWLGLSGFIGLAGCASMSETTQSPSLDGSAWVLSSLPGRNLVPGVTATARFEGGLVAGSDGCNRYALPYSSDGSAIEIGPRGPSTQMACPESIMAQAEAFTAALRSARSFRQGDAALDLLDASGAVVVALTAQAQSLSGTAWNVTNINNGRQAVVCIVSGSTVTMSFEPEGRVHGTTGCNQFTGTYSVDGDVLRISNVAATMRACADPAVDEQEQAFLQALRSVATVQFEGDHLELRREDGAMAIVMIRMR